MHFFIENVFELSSHFTLYSLSFQMKKTLSFFFAFSSNCPIKFKLSQSANEILLSGASEARTDKIAVNARHRANGY